MVLRVAFVPGVTPAKWFRVWAERHPRAPIEAVPLEGVLLARAARGEADPLAVLHDDRADAVLARLPIAGDGVHSIPLYAEVPTVVMPKEHVLSVLDEVPLAELEAAVVGGGPGERMLEVAESATGGPDAVELVAAGVGLLVLPKSLARLWSRRDVESRPVVGLPETRVALVWRTDLDAERAVLVEDFVGVVRGRTANSSRGSDATAAAAGAAARTGGADGETTRPKARQPRPQKKTPPLTPAQKKAQASQRYRPKPTPKPSKKKR